MEIRMLFNNLVKTRPQVREVFELLKREIDADREVRVTVSSWDSSLKPEGQKSGEHQTDTLRKWQKSVPLASI